MINAGYLRQYERERIDGEYSGQAELMAVAGEMAGSMKLNEGTHVYSEFSAKNMLPEGIPSRNRLMIFCPLHYNQVHLGYVALDGRSPSIEFNFLQTTLMLMENAMENIRRTHLLKQLNHRLHTLYVKDPLTGLYNRIGLERFGAPMFDRLRKEGKDVRFCFMDVDNMKEINAIYGYEMGDTALRMLADSVSAICSEEGCFGMRYGSDEFLLLGETDGDHIGERLEDAANKAAKDSGYPFRLRISLGQFVLSADEKLSLEACINKAGQKMIEDKKNHSA
jgi:diguanylate cyclase (GGDEF)-like protein